MAERPFIFFPRPTLVERKRLGGGGQKITKPSPAAQRTRLDTKFEQIANSFMQAAAAMPGLQPEQVIVFETISSIENVAKAVKEITGLEWLGESELAETDAQFGFEDQSDPAKRLPRRLYALFSNQNAMDSLLGLWRRWTERPEERAKTGFGPFKQLFIHLSDIRRWSPQDRIAETGLLDMWKEDIAVKGPQGNVSLEIELWFRAGAENRQRAEIDIRTLIQQFGGQILDAAVIEEIMYHGLLAEVPSVRAQQTIDGIQQNEYPELLRSEHVMFFRPHAQARFPATPLGEVAFNIEQRLNDAPTAAGDPIVAILDGVPLANHVALSGRLVIDDPDDHAARYEASQQQHGSAIASLAIHDDLHAAAPTLTKRVYMRPVLEPDGFGNEVTPPRKLLVDLIHRAVRRMFDGEGNVPPVAPEVLVINISIGDPGRPFVREMSSLARLIDWLAWRYKVLFVISAGNSLRPVVIQATDQTWSTLSDEEFLRQVLTAIKGEQHLRRLLSPAEAINAISVGSAHADHAPQFTMGNRVDVLKGRRLPSAMSTLGSGFRRSTKPDVLLPGGRQLFQAPATANGSSATFSAVRSALAPGNLTAVPGTGPMQLNGVGYSCGTSNAAALATHCTGIAAERLAQVATPPDCEVLDRACRTALLKTILVHSAMWGEAANTLESVLLNGDVDWRDRITLLQQFLGYGEVQPDRCWSADDKRATLLGWSSIGANEGQVFRLPLPPSLSAKREERRLTITLGWLTPTNQQHQDYRQAQLFLSFDESSLGVDFIGLDAKTTQRGTVEHRVFSGTRAKPFVDGDSLAVQVNCREEAGRFEGTIPFGLAVSLEVGQNVNIDVYNEVSARVRPQVAVQI